jgi:hypothetical protein
MAAALQQPAAFKGQDALCPMRPLKNAPFRPISASGSNFNPQNTPCILAVKIFAFLELRRNWTFFKGLPIQRLYNE